MGTNLLGELVANNGTYLVNKAGTIGVNFDKIIFLEDSKISQLDTDSTNISDYIADETKFIKAGAFLTPKNDEVFNFIELISGSVLLILA